MPHSRVPPAAALHELEYAVVDVETTGGGYSISERVVEVAAVVVRNGRVAESFSSLVNPQRAIPRPITQLTGISNTMVADAPSFADVADDLRSMLEKRIFVAHNVGFDWRFVGDELFRATGRVLSGDRICTVKLARRLLTHLPRRNLDALSEYYGVTNEARHRAFGDALATARVFERMLDELGRQGVHTWSDLQRMIKGRKKKKRTALPKTMTDWSIA